MSGAGYTDTEYSNTQWISISNIIFEITQFSMFKTGLFLEQGAVSIRKTVLPGMAIPMLKIRRPNGRLIFNMEIAIHR